MRPQNILYASIFAAGLGFSSAACAANAVVISVDKTSQRMTVSVDGATRYVWPVSTGRPGFDTPNGTFHPFRLDPDHHSTVYDNAPMPDSIFFTKSGDAVHGFFDTPHLGMAVSHGCVRLSPPNAAVLYGLVEQTGLSDTTVIIHGRIPTRNAPIVARQQAPEGEAVENGTPPPFLAPLAATLSSIFGTTSTR
jgi:lipoprotein-anchoring transpeptidase ErfK/SrfK